MTMVNSEVYIAFLKAGVPEADAAAAAKILFRRDSGLSHPENKIDQHGAELVLHRWALAIVFGLELLIIAKLMSMHG
jgi:hypothetical protein